MWKIAVFEADIASAQRLAMRLSALFANAGGALSRGVEAFDSPAALMEAAEGLDLIFLSEPLEWAGQVRRRAPGAEIVFLAGGELPLASLLWTRPIALVAPPYTDAQLASAIEAFDFYRSPDSVCFTVESRQQATRIRHADILYFESKAKLVYPRLVSGAASGFPARLDDVEARLRPYGYVRCHKSYLANLRHVTAWDKKNRQLVFAGGLSVPVSKQNCRAVTEAARKYRGW